MPEVEMKTVRAPQRTRHTKLPALPVLYTSVKPSGDPLVEMAVNKSIYYFRCSWNDKPGRYLKVT